MPSGGDVETPPRPTAAAARAEGDDGVALRIRSLSKHFPGTVALDDVSIEMRRGEIHALLGGNGSGKSTLIKILAGVERGDRGGRIEVSGFPPIDAEKTTPDWARVTNLRFVHQNPGVFPTLDVSENIAMGIGYPTGPGNRIKWDELREHTGELIRRYKIPGGNKTPVGALSPAGQTLVAIARALADQDETSGAVLVLDEPTASLPAREVELLMGQLRSMADQGQTILIVTHRLDEIVGVADRVSVLRDGKLVISQAMSDLNEERLVELIVGREVEAVAEETRNRTVGTDVLLEVEQLKLFPFLDKVSFQLHRGEVLGVAGLLGSGRSELLLALFGAVDRKGYARFMQQKGTIRLRGQEVRPGSTEEAMDLGFAYVPPDRSASATFIDWTIRRNVSISRIHEFFRSGRLRHSEERDAAMEAMDRFGVKAESEDQEIHQLSGGNQQKVIIARWLDRNPDVLLLDEPTQGVDVGARADIHRYIHDATDRGAGAILVTSDFEELARLSDRVLILHKGKFRAELTGDDLDAAHIEKLLNLIGIEQT